MNRLIHGCMMFQFLVKQLFLLGFGKHQVKIILQKKAPKKRNNRGLTNIKLVWNGRCEMKFILTEKD